jgi:type II secretory pathway pseudopilin PulG
MSLINCPECGHEVSTSAIECPNCGRPLHRPAAAPDTVITAVPRARDGFPTWAFIPLGILGALLLLVVFLMINRSGEEDANVNINIAAKRTAANTRSGSQTGSQTVTVPPATDTQVVTVPSSQTSTSTTTIPGTAGAPSDRGVVVIDAKVTSGSGSPQAVKNEKFYLLDDDLESILSDANLEPIEGQSLTNSLGMAVLFPDRYRDFYRDALKAINHHIKYSAQTDGSGKAQIGEIKPDTYYLFGVTRTGKGFAVWSSPVVVNAGQNALNLSPQPLTEMSD